VEAEQGPDRLHRDRYFSVGVPLVGLVIFLLYYIRGVPSAHLSIVLIGVVAGGWIASVELSPDLQPFVPAIAMLSGIWLGSCDLLIRLIDCVWRYGIPLYPIADIWVSWLSALTVYPAGIFWLARRPGLAPVAVLVAYEIIVRTFALAVSFPEDIYRLISDLMGLFGVVTLLVFGYLVGETKQARPKTSDDAI
jgi:hypothetical protein